MGDVPVSVLVKDLSGRLTSVSIKEFGLLWGIERDILNIKYNLYLIEAVLHDAQENRSRENEENLWLKSVRSASLTLENVLDEVLSEAKLQRLHKEKGIRYQVRSFFSSYHNQVMFRVRIGHKVKDIRRTLDTIASKRIKFGLTHGVVSHVHVDVASEISDETSTVIHNSELIIGRNEEIEMVIEKICNQDKGKHNNGEIPVYGIWGMGGIGKTTLAKLVYNHGRVDQYFEFKCWVSVLGDFQVKDLIQNIIACIDTSECTLTHLDVLQEYLHHKLRGKKFLIVLDDVLIEYTEKPKWDLLRETLSSGKEGSIVLVTTRSKITCQMMDIVPELQHNMHGLSEDDSWLLFKKLAFTEVTERDDVSELEHIGREIVAACKGLPLALKILGTFMRSKRSTSDWQSVKNKFTLREDNIGETSHILKLSYDSLLPHLKQCFAYCCLFPKEFVMEKDVVIQLWVVNGFIPPKGEIDLIVLGEEIFDSLVGRSFFIVVPNTKYSNVKFLMHDLIHDLALHVMGDECLAIEHSFKEVIIPNETLHLSASCPDIKISPNNVGNPTSLRSIFMFGENYKFSISQICNHVFVRVLYLCGIELSTLPESIRKLKYLKYLNLSYSSIEVLPESIIYLQNLQVLLLNFCHELYKLPEDMRYMSGLQILEIQSCPSLIHLPSGIKELTKPEQCPRFHVGNKKGAKIGELRDLDHFNGKLEISGLENVEDLDEAKRANLKGKRNLTVLKLSWSNKFMRESKREKFEYDKLVLEQLEPSSSLEVLSIYFYMGKSISPSWMFKLENLVEIGFSGCKRCSSIPSLLMFPKLRVIKLFGMDILESFHKEDTNFICLQELIIFMCPNLVSLPNNLPKLEILKLEECGALKSLPAEIRSLNCLKELEISGCKHLSQRYQQDKGADWHEISHIPKVTFKEEEMRLPKEGW